MQMSEILSNVLDDTLPGFTIRLPLSEEDKKEFQMMRFEVLVKRELARRAKARYAADPFSHAVPY